MGCAPTSSTSAITSRPKSSCSGRPTKPKERGSRRPLRHAAQENCQRSRHDHRELRSRRSRPTRRRALKPGLIDPYGREDFIADLENATATRSSSSPTTGKKTICPSRRPLRDVRLRNCLTPAEGLHRTSVATSVGAIWPANPNRRSAANALAPPSPHSSRPLTTTP